MADEYDSEFGNQVLYEMCAMRPLHDDPPTIFSKLWLIGKAYSVALERKAGDPDVVHKASRVLASGKLDEIISTVDHVEFVDHDNLREVVEAHSRFNNLLKQVTSRNRPSFAAKYLHFHRPNAFLIYDSVVDRNVRKNMPRKRYQIPPEWKEYHPGYAAFSLRALDFRDREVPGVSPRNLDRLLYPY